MLKLSLFEAEQKRFCVRSFKCKWAVAPGTEGGASKKLVSFYLTQTCTENFKNFQPFMLNRSRTMMERLKKNM